MDVGQDEDAQTFVVHKDLICARSPFFEAATSDRWTTSEEDSSDRVIPLPDHSWRSFHVYLKWLYNQDAKLKQVAEATLEGPKDLRLLQMSTLILAQAWVLGDFLGDWVFANAIMDCICSVKALPLVDGIAWIMDHTSSDCPLRLWLIIRLTACISKNWVDVLLVSGQQQLLNDLLRECLKRRGERPRDYDPLHGDSSVFHLIKAEEE